MSEEDRMLVRYANIISEYCKNTECDKCIIHNKFVKFHDESCPLAKILPTTHWNKILTTDYEVTDSDDRMILKGIISLCENCKKYIHCKDCRECVFTNPIRCLLTDMPSKWDMKKVIRHDEEKENGQ